MTRRLRLPLGVWLALGFALAVAAPTISAASRVVGGRRTPAGRRRRAGCARRARSSSRPARAWTTSGRAEPGARARRPGRRGRPAAGPAKDFEVGKPGQAELDARGHGLQARWCVERPRPAASSPTRWHTTLERPRGASASSRRAGDPGVWAPGRSCGTLFVARPSGAVRLAATSRRRAARARARADSRASILLRRWVVAPLARLAADAERIAGGELDVAPVNSRTREVAEVGAALRGMADGLRGALAEQHAAETQRRFLLSAIAHDLRTPLFTLRGSLEAIEHGIGDADHLRRAHDKATLLDRLVGDLFTFSRLEYAGARAGARRARRRRRSRTRRPTPSTRGSLRRRAGRAGGARRRPRRAAARARQPARQRRAPCATREVELRVARGGRRRALRGARRRPGHRARRPAAAVRAAVPRRPHAQQRHRRRRPRAWRSCSG